MTFTEALAVLLAGRKVRRTSSPSHFPNLHINEEGFVDFEYCGRNFPQFALHLVSLQATDWEEVKD